MCSLSKVTYLGNEFEQLQLSCYYGLAHINVEKTVGLLANPVLGKQSIQGTVISKKFGVRKPVLILDNRRI